MTNANSKQNILTASVSIQGFRPLLFHRFGPWSIPIDKQEKTGVGGNDPEEWRKSYTATDAGQLYIDPSYIFGSIRDGGAFQKRGRTPLRKLIAATLVVIDTIVLLDRRMPDDNKTPPEDPTAPVYLDIRGVVNPSTKSRNVRYRVAASAGWTVSFTLNWDKTVVSRDELHATIIDAGKLCGLGDGRSIGFGRFECLSFKVEDEKNAKKTPIS